MPERMLFDQDAPFSQEQREYLAREFARILYPIRVRLYIVIGLFALVNLIGFPFAVWLADRTASSQRDIVLERVCDNQNEAKQRQHAEINTLEDIIRDSTRPDPGDSPAEAQAKSDYRTTQVKRLETLRPGPPTDCSPLT